MKNIEKAKRMRYMNRRRLVVERTKRKKGVTATFETLIINNKTYEAADIKYKRLIKSIKSSD